MESLKTLATSLETNNTSNVLEMNEKNLGKEFRGAALSLTSSSFFFLFVRSFLCVVGDLDLDCFCVNSMY